MVVDYTSDIKLPGATPDEPEKEPVPILWIFDSFGRLNGYHCVISDDNEKCSLMTTPIPIPQYTEGKILNINIYIFLINFKVLIFSYCYFFFFFFFFLFFFFFFFFFFFLLIYSFIF